LKTFYDSFIASKSTDKLRGGAVNLSSEDQSNQTDFKNKNQVCVLNYSTIPKPHNTSHPLRFPGLFDLKHPQIESCKTAQKLWHGKIFLKAHKLLRSGLQDSN